MTYEALQKITMRRSDGTLQEVLPGQRFEIRNPATASRLILEGKLRELPREMTEGRRKTLEGMMDTDILEAIRKASQEGLRWAQAPEVDRIEVEIHGTFERVLKGRGKVEEYRKLVNEWLKEGTRHQDK